MNINRPGQEHHAHWHRNSLLTGVFYISTLENDNIIFYDPLLIKDYIKIVPTEFGNFWNARWWPINVTNNALVLFPSWLQHSVAENKSADTNRISISFNAFAKGIFGDKTDMTELIL